MTYGYCVLRIFYASFCQHNAPCALWNSSFFFFFNYTFLQEVSAILNNVIRHRVNNACLDLNLSEFILLFYIGEN